jgi:hypothetical protein
LILEIVNVLGADQAVPDEANLDPIVRSENP